MLVQYDTWYYKKDDNSEIDKDLWGIEIKEGQFSGVRMSINDVTLSENSSDLVLDYTILQIPDEKTKDFYQGQEFDDTISHIISDILNRAMSLHENRNNNTK